jgi:aminoglycoside phosphotransferase (APT) family kinase protein
MPERARPRLVGERTPFADVAPSVHDWLRDLYGPLRLVAEHRGGLSPGCASTVETRSGERLFVKATGAALSDGTVELFRLEAGVLAALRPADYRPRLLADFDDGDWVALVLAHVEGVTPDLERDDHFDAVVTSLTAQIAELTPAPQGMRVPALSGTAEGWLDRWWQVANDPDRYLPAWASVRAQELLDRARRLTADLDCSTLCHFDVRDDNLLIRDDGGGVVLDWGMAHLGPAWVDLATLGWQRADPVAADQAIRALVDDVHQESVTDLIVAFAGSQAWNCVHGGPRGLPAFEAYCREDRDRLLRLAAVRLDAD